VLEQNMKIAYKVFLLAQVFFFPKKEKV